MTAQTTPSPVDGGAAFPLPNERDPWGAGISEGSRGMSLRDWFAGQALNALGALPMDKPYAVELARRAYMTADAMLAARGPAR